MIIDTGQNGARKNSSKLYTSFLLLSLFAIISNVLASTSPKTKSSHQNKATKTLQEQSTPDQSPIDKKQMRELKKYLSGLVQKEVQPFEKKSWKAIFKQSTDAVVQIFSHLSIPDLLEPYKTPNEQLASGTGFFIDQEGHLLSNFHVVDHAKTLSIQIPSLGKERFEVEYIGGNPHRDACLLRLTDEALKSVKNKLENHTLTYLEFDDSDMLAEAQEIMVMGYPLGQENLKMALGNCSGTESSGRGGECKQTTAAVNPGNSGGPFLNDTGKVVGICVSKMVNVEAEGIGYLIPINNIKTILKELFTTKICKTPYWGCTLINTNEHTLKFLGNPCDGGVYVSSVKKESLSEQYGLQQGDVIYAIDDKKIDHFGYLKSSWSQTKISLFDYISRLEIGSTFLVTIYRKGEKKELTVEIKCESPFKINRYYPWYQEPLRYEVFGGLVIVELTLNHIELFKKIANYHGVDLFSIIKYEQQENRFQPRLAVVHIIPTSQTYRTSFDHDDRIIKKVNDVPVFTIDDFRNAVLLSKGKDYVTVEAEGGSFCAISLPEFFQKEDLFSNYFGYTKSSLIDELLASDEQQEEIIAAA